MLAKWNDAAAGVAKEITSVVAAAAVVAWRRLTDQK
jgi:hypothetical protein